MSAFISAQSSMIKIFLPTLVFLGIVCTVGCAGNTTILTYDESISKCKMNIKISGWDYSKKEYVNIYVDETLIPTENYIDRYYSGFSTKEHQSWDADFEFELPAGGHRLVVIDSSGKTVFEEEFEIQPGENWGFFTYYRGKTDSEFKFQFHVAQRKPGDLRWVDVT